MPYDARLSLYPLNGMPTVDQVPPVTKPFLRSTEDQQYSSSNMDDLIDSMARRHLAYRRLDVCNSTCRLLVTFVHRHPPFSGCD